MRRNISNAALEQYDADFIAEQMSLRAPQREALLRLETILTKIRAEVRRLPQMLLDNRGGF